MLTTFRLVRGLRPPVATDDFGPEMEKMRLALTILGFPVGDLPAVIGSRGPFCMFSALAGVVVERC